MVKRSTGITVKNSENSFSVFSLGYEQLSTLNRLENWYEFYPFSMSLWAHALADKTRRGDWWITRQNYHQIALELQVTGKVIFECDSYKTELNPNELFITHPGDTLTMQSTQGSSRQIQMLISGSMIKLLLESLGLPECRKLKLDDTDIEFMMGRFEQLYQLLKEQKQETGWKNSLICNELLLMIADRYHRSLNAEPKLPVLISRIISTMESEYGHHSSLEDLARQHGTSIRTIIRLFRQYLGVTPQAYWRKLRMERAKQLIEGSRKSFKEIASELGFKNAMYFSTSFRQYTGMSPSEYRKKKYFLS